MSEILLPTVHAPGEHRVVVIGRLIESTAEDFLDRIHSLLELHPGEPVVVRLGLCTGIDDAGRQALDTAREAADAAGSELRVAGVPPLIECVLTDATAADATP
jgi:hypothetical protein